MKLTSLAFQTDIALLRMGGSQVVDRGDHQVIRSPHNPSYWWGNFLLVEQVPGPESCASWLDRFAATFPAAEHVALGFDGTAGKSSDLDWFAERGYDVVVSTVMTATKVHEPATVNREASYRRLYSDSDWSQSVELRIRCEDRQLQPVDFRDFVTARTRTNRQITEAGQGGWFGAFIEDRLVAHMGLLAASPELARFQTVETDPQYRRRGLAGSLVYHVSEYGFSQLGAHTLVMVADPDYFAINLYQSVGFRATETQ